MTKNIRSITAKSTKELPSNTESKTLIEEAYNKIKQMIFQQTLVSGQRLIYRDLSGILNMSRTPIINALNRLEQEGFVISQSNRGFNVKPIDIQEAWDLFGVREALETYAIEEAIYHAGDNGTEALAEKLRNHEQYMPIRYDKKKVLLDAEFHLQIAKMAKNRALEDLLKINLEHIYLRIVLNAADPNRMPSAIQEHQQLIDRMKKKDVLGSIEILRLHVRNARNVIIAGISKGNEPIHLL